ncbi:hypothetical protein GGX14DRAFT_645630 [Mycena pura]|uniref:Uncharacterized protein n=1 Tax=Mycena pura TaxID=153505 RepID=A0AAD6VBF2_9AGAR|nr:hypothetical protein GGX14DRAFT_645630 [Mycena pura]
MYTAIRTSSALLPASSELSSATAAAPSLVPKLGLHNDLICCQYTLRGATSPSLAGVSVEKASYLTRQLKALPHIGISTQLSSDGRLERLALATCNEIILISVDSNAQSRLKMQGTALAELLMDGPVFVGFGIAHIALQIHRDIRAHFSNAVDLSTLCSPSTRETWAPSKLVGTPLGTHLCTLIVADSAAAARPLLQIRELTRT